MAFGLKIVIAALGFTIICLGFAVWLGSVFWNSNTLELAHRLRYEKPSQSPRKVDFKNLDALPAPVQRYFRFALKEGRPFVSSARAMEQGIFRTSGSKDKWKPFLATQYFSAALPGFIWDANIRMAPLLSIRVRDAYLGGLGSMQAKILSIFPVIDERGKKEISSGALHRYLAEAVWFPTALLPESGVKWSAIDEMSALATLSDSGNAVTLVFGFNDRGEIIRVSGKRYREVRGRFEQTPWLGKFRNYEERGGMMVPLEGEAGWQLPEGNLPYWKGRLSDIWFEFE